MVSTTYLDGFIPEEADLDECINCGICLQNCPVMKMSEEESVAEITKLVNNEETGRVLDECTFCFSCNHYCPNGLKPYNLILERMAAKNRENNVQLPPFISYMINGKDEPGFFNDQYDGMPAENKTILKKWYQPPPEAKDTLYIGCYGRTIPFGIENSKTLQSLQKYGPRDTCCGEIPHRFGDYPSFSEIADRTFHRLSSLKTDRLVCYCGSCANYMGNVWPDSHGLQLPFEIISLYEWLWEQYRAGMLKFQKKLSGNIVVSDSCYASELGDRFIDSVRGLYEAAGMTVVELENNKYDSLCCGFASMIRGNGEPSEVPPETKKKIDQILATKINDVSVNCPGCMGNLGQAVKGTDIKLHLAINEILKAFGDEPDH